MTVPKAMVDDATIFPMVAQIRDMMCKLLNSTNQLLVKYQASMNSTPTGILPPKSTSEGPKGSTKASRGNKKKNKMGNQSKEKKMWLRRQYPQRHENGYLRG